MTPGMQAPFFSGINQHGNEVKLSDFTGKKVILYFYPKDDTPGCTAEACSLRDGLADLASLNMEVVGVSADSSESHKKFAEKYNLPFHLIADSDKNIIKAYDVWGKKQFMGKTFDGIIRTTFIIDENGTIIHVIKDVNTKDHATQIKELMGA
ncbi:MAG: thioredoxin-dependent thiol peroxidase [Bacteroidia bacterium]|nr:thioredoxin-dependent thiol peroxidase [Bacteroidia bacterium]